MTKTRQPSLWLLLVVGSVLVMSLVVVSFARLAQAADARESITLSPVANHYNLKAGTVTHDSLKVVNDGTTAYDFIVYARPYSVTNNNYSEPNFSQSTERADAYKWVQFEKTQWHIEPGKVATVHYTIRVPKTAAPGGHYGVIFAETQPDDDAGQSVARKKRVGSLIYLTVDGKTIVKSAYQSSDLAWYQSRPPLEASSTVKNSGNVDFNAKVTMTVDDVFGHQKYARELSYVVLPDTSRELQVAWPNAPGLGLFKVHLKTQSPGESHEVSRYVLIVPRWVLVLAAIVIIGGIVYGVYRYRK